LVLPGVTIAGSFHSIPLRYSWATPGFAPALAVKTAKELIHHKFVRFIM
jgi:hypothetical protein